MAVPSRIAVIGSTAFSGSSFIDHALAEGHEVLGISRSPECHAALLPHLRHGGEKYRFRRHHLVEDIDGAVASLDAFEPDYVVNFAAQGEVASSFADPVAHFRTNAVGMVALGEAMRQRDYLKRFVQISTPEVYGSCDGPAREDQPLDPSSPYAASKASADLFFSVLHKTYGFPVVTTRATNVYGPYQQLYRIMPRTVIAIRSGGRIKLDGGGVAVKSYLYIDDVSRATLAAMTSGTDGAVYHLSPDGGGTTVRAIVETICRHMGAGFDEVVETGPERIGQDKAYVLDSSRARQEFGWAPQVGLEQGIANVVAWVDRYWNEIKGLPKDYCFRP